MPTTLFITDLNDPAQSALFDRVHALYERSFPANECHSRDALLRNLQANAARTDNKTVWFACVNDAGAVLGGGACYMAPGDDTCDRLVTIGYFAVEPAARGQGVGRKMEADVISYAARLHGKPDTRILLVCDVEDPQKMADADLSRDDYASSAQASGITPFQRLIFWRDKMGYRATDFPYVLKANRLGAQATAILTLHARLVHGADSVPLTKVSAKLLREAASFINCECAYTSLPLEYREHPALQSMWAWPESYTYAHVSDRLADECAHLENHWA